MLNRHRSGTSMLLCVILLAGVGSIAESQESGSATGEPPRIEVAEPTLDLGAVPRGEAVEAHYRIRNTGGTTLNILRVKPG